MCSFFILSSESFKRVHLDDPNDAFWLAQTYFMTHQYSRAERLLTRPFPTTSPKKPQSPPPVANGHTPHFQSGKGKGRDYDASQVLLSIPRLPVGPGGVIEVSEEMQDRVSRLVDMSVACRYLAAQCQVRCSLYISSESLLKFILGPSRKLGRSDRNVRRS